MTETIKRLRRDRGWSQRDLALASGVSERTVQRIEAGRPASLETQCALAAALGVDTVEITAGADADTGEQRTSPFTRIPVGWQPFAQHTAAFLLGQGLVVFVSIALGITARLPVGVAMLWGGFLLVWLAVRLHRLERTGQT
ncbi:MAG: helix-turn-helix transcriptional regulator [Pseudomonadota bacterium]|nr:helix-turn-helix transcriptional regulator [Pseudomonadota bacterium]